MTHFFGIKDGARLSNRFKLVKGFSEQRSDEGEGGQGAVYHQSALEPKPQEKQGAYQTRLNQLAANQPFFMRRSVNNDNKAPYLLEIVPATIVAQLKQKGFSQKDLYTCSKRVFQQELNDPLSPILPFLRQDYRVSALSTGLAMLMASLLNVFAILPNLIPTATQLMPIFAAASAFAGMFLVLSTVVYCLDFVLQVTSIQENNPALAAQKGFPLHMFKDSCKRFGMQLFPLVGAQLAVLLLQHFALSALMAGSSYGLPILVGVIVASGLIAGMMACAATAFFERDVKQSPRQLASTLMKHAVLGMLLAVSLLFPTVASVYALPSAVGLSVSLALPTLFGFLLGRTNANKGDNITKGYRDQAVAFFNTENSKEAQLMLPCSGMSSKKMTPKQ
ncbi:MAG: hypothetical protein DHS20C10_12590 [marine bacterium B5-7]|nr:MAG: hypothetical protein DHS20C10_12590 [marine bacterium B5-7]